MLKLALWKEDEKKRWYDNTMNFVIHRIVKMIQY